MEAVTNIRRMKCTLDPDPEVTEVEDRQQPEKR